MILATTNNQEPSKTIHAEGEYTSPAKLARRWGVHVQTIYRDIRKGALRASRMPGGQLRISIADARRYGRPIE